MLCCAVQMYQLMQKLLSAQVSTAWSQAMQPTELPCTHPCRDMDLWGQPSPTCLHPTSLPYFPCIDKAWVSETANPGPFPRLVAASHALVIRYQ